MKENCIEKYFDFKTVLDTPNHRFGTRTDDWLHLQSKNKQPEMFTLSGVEVYFVTFPCKQSLFKASY